MLILERAALGWTIAASTVTLDRLFTLFDCLPVTYESENMMSVGFSPIGARNVTKSFHIVKPRKL